MVVLYLIISVLIIIFLTARLKVHPFIYKSKRRHSKEAAELAREWFNNEAPEMYKSLITQTAAFNRHIVIFLLSLGFKKVGKYSEAFKRDGAYHDVIHFQYMRVGRWAI